MRHRPTASLEGSSHLDPHPILAVFGVLAFGLAACTRAAEEPRRSGADAGASIAPTVAAEAWYYVARYAASTASQPLEREDCVWDRTGGYQLRTFSGGTLRELREAPVGASVAALQQLAAHLNGVSPFRISRGSRLPYEDAPVPEYLWVVVGSGSRLSQFAGHFPDWPDALRAKVLAVLAEARAGAPTISGDPTARMYAVPVLRSAVVDLETGAGGAPAHPEWVRFFQRPFRLLPAAGPPAVSPAFPEYQGLQYQLHHLPVTPQTP